MFENKYCFVFLSLLFVFNIGCRKQSSYIYPAKPQLNISAADARLRSNVIHFFRDTVYVIVGNISADSGQTFSIDAGTLVKVNKGAGIEIKRGATIQANGTMNEPVVFTVNEPQGRGGVGPIDIRRFWNGLRITGNANGQSSGVLTYTRVEFAGNGGNGAAALQLIGVNKQTTINNIQVSYSLNNAFGFAGGDCNAFNLFSFASSGVDFNITGGYTGNLQQLLSFRDPELANTDANLSGIFIGGTGTSPLISNLTIMRPGLKAGLNGVSGNYSLGAPNRRAAIVVAENASFRIRNSVVIGLPSDRNTLTNNIDTATSRAFFIQGFPAAAALDSGRSELSWSVFFQSDSNAFYLSPNSYQGYTSSDLREFLKRPQYHNEIFSQVSAFGFMDPYLYNYYYSSLSPLLAAGSPLLNGADFTGPAFSDPFFKKVSYRGAVGNDNWLQGWTNYLPLQTDYNN